MQKKLRPKCIRLPESTSRFGVLDLNLPPLELLEDGQTSSPKRAPNCRRWWSRHTSATFEQSQ